MPFFLFLLLHLLVSAAEPGKRTVEVYLSREMSSSIKMIKENMYGARDDFYSDFGYSHKYPSSFLRAAKQSGYRIHLYCENKVFKKVNWKFSI